MLCSALEPVISGEIMELHHAKHHQTYVNSFNAAYEKYKEVGHIMQLPGQQVNRSDYQRHTIWGAKTTDGHVKHLQRIFAYMGKFPFPI